MDEMSTGVKCAWQMAAVEASTAFFERIEPVHLLIGVCSVEKLLTPDVAARSQLSGEPLRKARAEWEAIVTLVESCGSTPVDLRRQLRAAAGEGNYQEETRREVSRSTASRDVFRRAAKASQGGVLRLPHLLATLLDDEASPLCQQLRTLGLDTSKLRSAAAGPGAATTADTAPREGGTPNLEKYGRDLTELARAGKLQACIGRRDEMLQLVRSLSRATKNNPLLLGEAGVGKTAIVEGLAWRIANRKSLPDKRIVELQMATLVSGTKYRGEFEERLTQIIAEAERCPELILFIDEIHGIVGAGDSSGRMDAANILKPALARGSIRCIGATTFAEYRKFVEKDPALERRFHPVTVAEPSKEEALQILEAGYVRRFEERHGVVIEPAAIRAAVRLSLRYLPDRRLPDKAIDLLDETCALVAVPALSAMPGEKPEATGGVVTADAVAEVISKWTGIPAGRLDEDDRERLQRMPEELKARVIGQDEACEKVAAVVQRARAGLKAESRPVGVFLFTGPTGVGKTELAKATAAFLFGSEEAMVRIDMSEFMERHSVSRLIGAPPGYIGHDEEGQLTGALRRTPYSVVLLDEVEKAHPDVLNLFLQVFDDGRLTDSRGRTVDAASALFILTSNVGAISAEPGRSPFSGGMDESTSAAKEFVRKSFRPEFLNRLDDIIVFSALSPASTTRIADLMIQGLGKRLKAREIGIRATDAAVAWLSGTGYDTAFGARALRRTIEQHVERPLVEMILRDEIGPGKTVSVDVKDGMLWMEVVRTEEEKH